MTKSSIRSNLTVFNTDIAAVHAQGLDYILGETNSYSCHGAPGVSNTAGAALWALDYALFASQIGISRVYFHHGVGNKYNFVRMFPMIVLFSYINLRLSLILSTSDPTSHSQSLHPRRIPTASSIAAAHPARILCSSHRGGSYW